MARWFAFDGDSALKLTDSVPNETVTLQTGSAVRGALAEPSASVVLMQGRNERAVVMLRLNRMNQAYEAMGVLGLMGDAVYEDELPLEESKPWWKRIF